MRYIALREVGSVEAQMLPWQHTSHFSLNLVRNIYGFDRSYVRSRLNLL